MTPEYFSALGIPHLRGRLFETRDRGEGPPVVVVNQALALALWPGEEALGKRLTSENPQSGTPEWAEVVGVVGNLRHIRLDQPTAPVAYRVMEQGRDGFFQDWGMDLVIRTEGDPLPLVPAVKATLAEAAPELPVFGIRTLEEVLEQDLAVRRFTLVLLGLFAATALALAILGLYGVLAYGMRQQTRELGVRMALGASRGQILQRILVQGLGPVLAGLLVGLGLATLATPHLSALLYEVSETDPGTFAATAALLLTVAWPATCLPAGPRGSIR